MSPFQAWLSHVANEGADRATARGVGPWIVTTLFVAVLFAICQFFGPAHDLTGLELESAMLAYAPLPLMAVVIEIVARRGPARARVALLIFGTFVVGTFPAALVGLALPRGAAIFAGLYIVTVLFHSQLLRVSARWPYFVFAFLAQALISLRIDPSDDKLTLWALLFPAAATSGLLAGTFSLRADEQRAELERTKNALHAQLLELEAQKGRDLEEYVSELLGIAHDIKSPLTAATLDLAALKRELDATAHPSLAQHANAVGESIAKLRTLFRSTREKNAAGLLQPRAVEIATVVETAVRDLSRRFPDVRFEVQMEPPGAQVLTVGGPQTLERIVVNLLVNACEGDGTRAARTVTVSSGRDGVWLVLSVRDDGPGFTSEALSRPIATFETTKKTGTGLGLFTVQRLARACRGELVRDNVAEGGARVKVTLPAA